MAYTLIEHAKLLANSEPIRSSIIETYPMASDILRVLPFKDIQGNSYRYNQEQTLPGIGFRGVNGSYTASTGILNPQTEPLIIAGGSLAIDPFLVKTGSQDVATQQLLKAKALALAWTKAFLKGDSTTDKTSLDGLQNRITGNQLIDAGSTSGGDALSLALLDKLIDAVDNPTHLIMNKTMRRRLSAAARTTSVGGYIRWEKDEFGRQIAYYGDLPILIFDFDHTGTQILPFTEACASGNAYGTSIYCVSLGDGMLQGIQSGPMEVRNIGRVSTTVADYTEVEWYNGIAIEHPRAAARLRYIKDAAVVA